VPLREIEEEALKGATTIGEEEGRAKARPYKDLGRLVKDQVLEQVKDSAAAKRCALQFLEKVRDLLPCLLGIVDGDFAGFF
jgi:hypothetical protein